MTAPPAPAHAPELVLTGPKTPALDLVRRVAASRELIVTLGRKNFFVQYRRTSLGALWAVALPLLQALLFAVIFSRIGRFSVHHYPVFVLSGMVGWTFFIGTLVPGTTSIVDNASLSSKVYFPRAVLPLSLCLGALYSFAASVLVVIVLGVSLDGGASIHILLLIPAIVLDVGLTVSCCLALSVAHVYLRDTRYIVQALAVGWLWVTPVIYPLSAIHGWVRALVEVNPVTGIVQLFHAAFSQSIGPAGPIVGSLVWTAAIAALAVWLHARFDRVVSDLL